MTMICSVSDLIDGLGGTTAVAEWASVDMSAVSHWRRGGIPAGWHYRLFRECERRGLDVDFDAVFGDCLARPPKVEADAGAAPAE